jgi:hypothetical protein
MNVYLTADCSGVAAGAITGVGSSDCKNLAASTYATVDCGVNAAFTNAPVTVAVAALLAIVAVFNKFAF